MLAIAPSPDWLRPMAACEFVGCSWPAFNRLCDEGHLLEGRDWRSVRGKRREFRRVSLERLVTSPRGERLRANTATHLGRTRPPARLTRRERRQRVLELYWLQGESGTGTAEQLGVSAGTVLADAALFGITDAAWRHRHRRRVIQCGYRHCGELIDVARSDAGRRVYCSNAHKALGMYEEGRGMAAAVVEGYPGRAQQKWKGRWGGHLGAEHGAKGGKPRFEETLNEDERRRLVDMVKAGASSREISLALTGTDARRTAAQGAKKRILSKIARSRALA